MFGTSIAFYGAITMKRGAVEIVKSDGRPGGIGEPGVPPNAPAIANALFALTGTRVRDLPFIRSEPLRQAGLV